MISFVKIKNIILKDLKHTLIAIGKEARYHVLQEVRSLFYLVGNLAKDLNKDGTFTVIGKEAN